LRGKLDRFEELELLVREAAILVGGGALEKACATIRN